MNVVSSISSSTNVCNLMRSFWTISRCSNSSRLNLFNGI
jgi:hypothetical protein